MASPLPSTFFNPCSGDSPEDLCCKLMYTSMELQKVRAKGRLQETELWRLKELLSIMMKERDEAREECRRLQDCVLLQQTPAMGVDSASSFMHSSSMVSSPSSSPWSLQELEEHLNSDDFCASVGAPTPFELQQALESLVGSCDKGQPFSYMKPGNESALEDYHQGTHREALNRALCFDAPPCLSLPELRASDELVCTRSPSVRCLSRQSSSNSSSACVQRLQKGQVSMESLDAMAAVHIGVPQSSPAMAMASMVSNSAPSASMGCNALYASQQILPVASFVGSSVSTIASESMPPMPTMGSSGPCPISYNASVSDNVSCMNNRVSPSAPIKCNNGASVAINVSPQVSCMANDRLLINTSASCSMPVKADSVASLVNTNSPLRSSMGSNAPPIASNGPTGCMVESMGCPTLAMAKNEVSSLTSSIANSQPSAPFAKALSTGLVPTSSSHCHQQPIATPVRQFHLPEPPEADPQVMLNSLPEKGKLLQAVMQAGPLLQTLLLAGPLPQWRHPPPALSTRDIPKVSLVPGHVSLTPGGHNGLPSTTTRKRIAIGESCLQNKKLRRLSPSPPKKRQVGCMASGGSERQELVH